MDFLRSVAILTVVLAHSILSFGAPAVLAPLQFGGTGVDLFFVLSGWLLGGQLFKEANAVHGVDVRRFWVRRWMRTLPAYYAVLIVTVLQRYLTKDDVGFPWEYFVFLQNYHHPMEFFSISWSLCVEEQFYLLIAPLVAVSVFVGRTATTGTLLVLLLAPLLFRSYGLYSDLEQTHVRIDGCVAGVLLAHLNRNYPLLWQSLGRYSGMLALGGLTAYLYFVVARYVPALPFSSPDVIVLALVFSSWVIYANSSIDRRNALYFPGAYYVATRSYALYLVHPEMLAILKRLALGVPFPVYFIMAVCGSLLLSEALYRLIEKPFMDARERFAFSSAKKLSSIPETQSRSGH